MWRLVGNQASWRSDRFSVDIDLLQPWKGLLGVRLGSARPLQENASPRILQIRTRGESSDGDEVLADRYVRGADLVAAYAQTPHRRFRPQVYWRILDGAEAVGVELMISIETNLLQSEPNVRVLSAVEASEIWRRGGAEEAPMRRVGGEGAGPDESAALEGPGLFLFRLADLSYSYAEMAGAGELTRARLSLGGEGVESVLTWNLFREPLEKGVIRRARLRGLFVPREGDREKALDCYRRLSAAAPPLTA